MCHYGTAGCWCLLLTYERFHLEKKTVSHTVNVPAPGTESEKGSLVDLTKRV